MQLCRRLQNAQHFPERHVGSGGEHVRELAEDNIKLSASEGSSSTSPSCQVTFTSAMREFSRGTLKQRRCQVDGLPVRTESGCRDGHDSCATAHVQNGHAALTPANRTRWAGGGVVKTSSGAN